MRRRSFSENNSASALIEEKRFDYSTDLISEEAFNLHLDLYRNYIRQTNNKIDNIQLDTYNSNAIILHELYFENITTAIDATPESVVKFFKDNFGNFQDWMMDFLELSMSVQSKGWVCLVYSAITNKYKNIKMSSHDDGLSYDSKILLVSDLFEHNYIGTYGTDKKMYASRFFDCINWDVVFKRIGECNK